VLRKDADADRRRDVDLVGPDLEGQGDGGANALGHLAGVVAAVDVGQQHHELVATDACQGVGFPQALAHALRCGDQQAVTHRVAAGVVHRLEVVQIDEHQRRPAALPARPGQGRLQPVGEQGPVGQLGEGSCWAMWRMYSSRSRSSRVIAWARAKARARPVTSCHVEQGQQQAHADPRPGDDARRFVALPQLEGGRRAHLQGPAVLGEFDVLDGREAGQGAVGLGFGVEHQPLGQRLGAVVDAQRDAR
jgi:hypothetical protein